jgi:hypothetical protein
MLTRIFGDRPFVAVAKLLALSLLVGLALTAIGIDPLHLVGSLQRKSPFRYASLGVALLSIGGHARYPELDVGALVSSGLRNGNRCIQPDVSDA